MVLCFVVIKNDMFATGSKDGTIKIWEKDKEIICLEGHRGSICTLSVLKQSGVSISLVSGSDNGDNSIKIWNL